MIPIKKGREPESLAHYRRQTFAAYDNMPNGIKEEVLNSLIKEQGCICAYCMCRIPQKHPNPGQPAATIEHFNPQSKTDVAMGLSYGNMLAVCSGNRGGGADYFTCDNKRNNRDLHVNPLNSETLESIFYHSDGRIASHDPLIDNELNDVLGLNCIEIGLPENRKNALQALLCKVKKEHPTGDIRQYCARLLTHYESQDVKQPYVGIMIDWLKKHS